MCVCVCVCADDNVDVIYLAPKPVGEDLSQYYTRLLALKNAVQLGDPDAPKHPCGSDAQTHTQFTMALSSLIGCLIHWNVTN